jgi:hypothetical protein
MASFCNMCIRKGSKHCLECKWPNSASEPTHFVENLIDNKEDEINKPSHYHKGGIDVIGFAELHYSKEELKGFYRINIIKYVDRYDTKGGLKSLEKAEFYLKKLMELENNG